MNAELTVLVLAALLLALQFGSGAVSTSREGGAGWLQGPRDTARDFSVTTQRLRRAAANHTEGLLLYAIAALVLTVTNQTSALTAALAWAYLVARILYVPAYALAWTPGRSIIWGIGLLATLLMLFSTLF